jgi:hypothetical protein
VTNRGVVALLAGLAVLVVRGYDELSHTFLVEAYVRFP